jgi:hypothetical protein
MGSSFSFTKLFTTVINKCLLKATVLVPVEPFQLRVELLKGSLWKGLLARDKHSCKKLYINGPRFRFYKAFSSVITVCAFLALTALPNLLV